MIKSELIANIIAKMQDVPEKAVTDGVNLLLDTMSEALSEGRRIEIRGFGSFCLHYRPPRNAHNPKTGDKVITEPKYSPHFKPGKALRERIDQSKSEIAIIQDETSDVEEY